jgi:hypothetical protein
MNLTGISVIYQNLKNPQFNFLIFFKFEPTQAQFSQAKNHLLIYNFYKIKDSSQLRVHVNVYSKQKAIFHPGKPIIVHCTAERNHGPHLFHLYTYTLHFTHMHYTWRVSRSYKEIRDVHKTLAKWVESDIGRPCADIPRDDIKSDWPLFPDDHDHATAASATTAHDLHLRCTHLAEYLQRLLTYPPFRDHTHVLHLVGVSPVSFIIGLSPSLIEDVVHKSSGENKYTGHLSQLKIGYDNAKIFHAKRWFILKDTYLFYLNEDEGHKVGFILSYLLSQIFFFNYSHFFRYNLIPAF